MKKKSIIGIVTASMLILGILGGCGARAEETTSTTETEVITINHSAGETKVTKKPKTVVVLDYGSIDILDTMGVEVAGLPKSSTLPAYLEKYKSDEYIDIGTLKEPNLEKINELNPDLIIIESRQAELYKDFSEIAPTIQLGTEGTDYFASVEKNVNILAEIFNKENIAKEELKKLELRVKSIKEKVQSENLNALVNLVSDGSMSIYGEGSRFNSIYGNFGFTTTDKDIEVSNHGQSISYEYLAEKNPNYLFVIDKGAATQKESQPAKEIVETELVKTTDAYKNGNIVYLDSSAWYIGGAGLKAADQITTDIENALKMNVAK